MESLQGRVALVTGGGSGIGRTTCIELARYGAKVVLSDISAEEAQQTVSIITKKYPNSLVIALKCDVSSPTDVAAMVTATVEKFGRLDFAVNCAGIGGTFAKVSDYDDDMFDLLVKVNLKGVYLCMKQQLIQILQQEKATHYSIVNISSISGLIGFRLNAPYAAVKHGVVGLTKSAALDYSRSGIRINAVCPAFIVTPMTAPFNQDNTPEGEKFKNRVPMGRLGTAEEVASCILWLLSDASSFTTGAAVTVDGGMSCL